MQDYRTILAISEQMESISTDVLIIGAGAAGIRAAVAACEGDADVVLAAAHDVAYGGSTFSEIANGWGIQALIGAERTAENFEDFYDDIIRIGLGQSDPPMARILVEESGPRVEDLITHGLKFKKDPDGRHIRANGCFSKTARAFLTSDMNNIRRTFLSILRRLPVRVVTGTATDLILVEGTCLGARMMLKPGVFVQINAKSTILATGGGSGIFQEHMGNGGGTGDGYALAHLAGAKLTNMEFIQFALGLKKYDTRKFLPIAELNSPAKMINSRGQDILEKYIQPDERRDKCVEERQHHMPFSCRDSSGLVDIAVAKALGADEKIYWQNGGSKNDRYHVVQFAHAFNGGIKVNAQAESSVPGLFAAGEVAAGPHGADRMGGCMMTATQVFGKRAGQFAAKRAINCREKCLPADRQEEAIPCPLSEISNKVLNASAAIENSVKTAMGLYAGVLRSQEGLMKCKKVLETCAHQLSELGTTGLSNFERYYNVRNMIITANLVAKGALSRKQSKGTHYREDDAEAQG